MNRNRSNPIQRSFGFAFFLVVALSSTSAGVLLADLDRAAEEEQAVAVADLTPFGPPAPQLDFTVTSGKIQAGGSLNSSLRGQGISATVVHEISRSMRPVFDFRRARSGHEYRLIQRGDGSIVDFRYMTSVLEAFHLFREGDRFVAEREEPELVSRTTRVAGIVNSSLYSALRNLGERPELGQRFTDVFAWDVDFSRSVQQGDKFNILYERLYRLDEEGQELYVGPGKIFAATYEGASGRHIAVHFEQEDGSSGYYRPDGTSVEREFLVAPLSYSRITSRFTNARRHPILKITRPHHGIDYAAPPGSPIWSVADGTVVFKGWSKGYGRLVKVRHATGHVSYYAHMSRFKSDLKVGQKVDQKEVIGYVGSSGLSTGPHVCFRIRKDGRYVNPVSLKSPAGKPVPAEAMTEFRSHRDAMLDELQGAGRREASVAASESVQKTAAAF